jgi:filamentous hemagglutinin family protein
MVRHVHFRDRAAGSGGSPGTGRVRALAAAVLAAVGLGVARPAPAQIVADGTLGAGGALAGRHVTIGAELGQRRGGNLFHSFHEFSLRAGQSATFAGPAGIDHVIARVTGGRPSTIDGLVRSEIAGADLWLLNPSGVLLGRHARLDVPGGVHMSTGSYLRLTDGSRFHGDRAHASTLEVAPPAAFGFLGTRAAAITVRSDALSVPDRQGLSLVGGDVRVQGAMIRARGGRVNLASARAPGEIVLRRHGEPTLEADGVPALGSVTLAGATIVVGGDAASGGNGTVAVRAGRLVIAGGSSLLAQNFSPTDGAPLAVDLAARGRVRVDASDISGGALGTGRGGGVRIDAGSVVLAGGAIVDTGAIDGAAGGDIAVTARGFVAIAGSPGSSLVTRTSGSAAAGAIAIDAATLRLRDHGHVLSTTSGSGPTGQVTVNASRKVVLEGPGVAGTLSGLLNVGDSTSSGDAGAIVVVAPALVVTNGAMIGALGLGAGPGGSINLDVGRLTVARGALVTTTTSGPGAGGALEVRARGSIAITDAEMSSEAFGTGDAGAIALSTPAGRVRLSGGVVDSSSGVGDSAGGRITIRGGTLSMARGSAVTAGTFAEGPGGDIAVHVRRLKMSGESTIGSDSSRTGHAGDIRLEASSVWMSGQSTVTSSTERGTGGSITIVADGPVVLSGSLGEGPDAGQTSLRTTSNFFGRGGGDIVVRARRLELTGGAVVLSSTFGSGPAGDIVVEVDALRVVGRDGAILSGLVSGTSGAGAGGRITVRAGAVNLRHRALITTAAVGLLIGRGNAGDIHLDVDRLSVSDTSAVTSATLGRGTSPAGQVRVTARGPISLRSTRAELLSFELNGVTLGSVLLGARIDSTAFRDGDGGTVIVETPGVFTASGPGSGLSTEALTGRAGNIELRAGTVRLLDRAAVASTSRGAGDAGNVAVAGRDMLADHARVSTQADLAKGGNVVLDIDGLLRLQRSEVTASVAAGEGEGGNVTIARNLAILDHSTVKATADGGPGGRIEIATGVFLQSSSLLDASSRQDISGTIAVDAPVTSAAGAAAPPARELVSAAALLPARCWARSAPRAPSRFVLRGREGFPPGPAGWLDAGEGAGDSTLALEPRRSPRTRPPGGVEPSGRRLGPRGSDPAPADATVAGTLGFGPAVGSPAACAKPPRGVRP